MAVERLSFPAFAPTTYSVLDDEPEFDAERHLALEMPEDIITLETLGYDKSVREQSPSQFAVTGAFSVLSPAGVEAAKRVSVALKEELLTENDPEAAYIKSRGSAYRSRFFRSLWHCPRLLEFFSDMTGTTLVAHPLSSVGVVVIYAPRDPGKTNQGWHLDSLGGLTNLVTLNEPDTLQGGGFQYFHGTREEVEVVMGTSAESLRKSVGQRTELPAENIVTVNYPRAGHGVLVQGNLVLHRGEPLRAAGERMVFGTAFIAEDVDYPDVNHWREISTWNSPTMKSEYARHKAWRAKQLLERVSEVAVDGDREDLRQAIELAKNELTSASEALEQK